MNTNEVLVLHQKNLAEKMRLAESLVLVSRQTTREYEYHHSLVEEYLQAPGDSTDTMPTEFAKLLQIQSCIEAREGFIRCMKALMETMGHLKKLIDEEEAVIRSLEA